ncbi:carboxyl transferase domain-containing protein [Pseudonocardia nigra]|uniref:carboxyl transferase domain-containing protein n=1 Tax=Pseudonocardia nigra TaxID=1921578 RepID=UPI001FEA7E4E|nr:carboxyl transferase domain-containing protein [Pseudonocardia nigra]
MTMTRRTAAELLRTVLDSGSYRSWDTSPDHRHADPGYRRQLADAAAASGADEAVLTGEGRIAGRDVAVVCSEFGFLAGSIGAATADRIVAAVERATARHLPLLAATASGGTRMQEGTPAFLRMADITAAITAHKAVGLPYLVYLRHPTTGGVLASWGSLGHVTVAEPGALIGFLGPKVHAALHDGTPFPPGVQTAEHLHTHGILDGVLPVEHLAATAARVLALLDPATSTAPEPPPEPSGPADSAWAHVTATRDPDRPGARELLRATTDAVPLAGTGQGETGTGVLLALARFGGAPCVLVAQDRRRQAHRPLGPGALRVARRGMRLAAELGLPLVTVVDTPGAALTPAAEEGGLAGEIARCLADLVALPVPTVSVLLGQGTGGAALALLPADAVLAARHAWLTPLPPEGAAAILHGSVDRAADVAAAQRIRAADLREIGAVDRIVDERPDAAAEPSAFTGRVAHAIEAELHRLAALPAAERRAARRDRLRGGWRAGARTPGPGEEETT